MWIEALQQVEPLPLRAKAASIVWWDYAKPYWPVLGEIAFDYDASVQIKQEDVYRALRLVGYSVKAAKLRSTIPNTSLTYHRPESKRKRATRCEMIQPDAVPHELGTTAKKRWLL